MKRIDLSLSILFTSFFAFLYFITTNQIFSFDAVTNAIACESGEILRWFHPNHPLYPFLGVLYFKFEQHFGYHGFSIYSLARLNSLLMSIALGILYFRLAPLTGRGRSVAVVLFLGSCYSVWNYAVDGRAVGASVFFSILVIGQIIQLSKQQEIKPEEIFKLGVYSSLYILIHAIAIFHVLPILWWLVHKETYYRKNVFIYLGVLGGLLGLSYLTIYLGVIKPASQESFISWAMGYAGHNGSAHLGQSRFWVHDVKQGFWGIWEGWRNSFLGPTSTGQHSHEKISDLVAIFFAGQVVYSGLISFTIRGKNFSLINLLFVWGIFMMGFLTFWSPGQEGFRLHVLVPWIVAMSLALPPSKWVSWGGIFLALLLFIYNLKGPISYQANIKNNQGFQLLRELEGKVDPGDLFLCANGSFIPNYEVLRPYFFPQLKGGTVEGRLLAFHENSLTPLKIRLQKNQQENHANYLGEDILDKNWQESFERINNINIGSIENFLKSFKLKEAFELSNGRRIYAATNN